jgi:hypothetical protein
VKKIGEGRVELGFEFVDEANYVAYVAALITDQGIDPQLYDVTGYYDSTLTVDENIRILCEAYPTLRACFVTRPNFAEWLRAYEQARRAEGIVRLLTWWL